MPSWCSSLDHRVGWQAGLWDGLFLSVAGARPRTEELNRRKTCSVSAETPYWTMPSRVVPQSTQATYRGVRERARPDAVKTQKMLRGPRCSFLQRAKARPPAPALQVGGLPETPVVRSPALQPLLADGGPPWIRALGRQYRVPCP